MLILLALILASGIILIKDNRTDGIPVLCFHRIVKDDVKEKYYENNKWVSDKSTFEAEMKWLKDNCYECLSLEEFYKLKHSGGDTSKKVLLTFDDGDYEFYYLVKPILDKYDFKATMFLIGSKVGKTTAPLTYKRGRLGQDVISKMENVDFESHSYDLHEKRGWTEEFSPIKRGVALSKYYLELKSDSEKTKGATALAYPFGDYNADYIKALKDSGYKMGFKFSYIDQKKCNMETDDFQIPRIRVTGDMDLTDFVQAMRN